jgi:hypothetical protein
VSLGFTCPKSEGNYGAWYQWSVNKCLDASVRETLVWVTGDTHPFFDMLSILLYNLSLKKPVVIKPNMYRIQS